MNDLDVWRIMSQAPAEDPTITLLWQSALVVVFVVLVVFMLIVIKRHSDNPFYSQIHKKDREQEAFDREEYKSITTNQIQAALTTGDYERANFLLNHITKPITVKPKWVLFSELLGYTSNEEQKALVVSEFFMKFKHLDVSFERTVYLFGKTSAINIFRLNTSEH